MIKAMFKSELAKLAGVSSRTFRRYLATRRAILTTMGVSPFAHVVSLHCLRETKIAGTCTNNFSYVH